MGYLDRYKEKTKRAFPDNSLAPFIKSSLNKISIHKVENETILEEELEAVLIFKDRDGPDLGILYTYADDGLSIGDTIVKKGAEDDRDSYYMLVEEVKRVDGSKVIRVFNVYEANVWIDGKVLRPAYLLSTLKNSVKVSELTNINKEIKDATLVFPTEYGIKINQILNFKNIITKYDSYSSWRVEGKDDVSASGIVFAYLEQVVKTEIEEEKEVDDMLPIGSVVSLDSLNGYVRTTAKIDILKRSQTSVEVRLPLENGEYHFELKDANGEIYRKIIKVG